MKLELGYLLAVVLSSASCADAADTRAPVPPGAVPPGSNSPAASRCPIDATTGDVSCSNQTMTIGGRQVVYQVPLGAAPADGWPVVLMLQGSFYGPNLMWSAKPGDSLAQFTMPQTLA